MWLLTPDGCGHDAEVGAGGAGLRAVPRRARWPGVSRCSGLAVPDVARASLLAMVLLMMVHVQRVLQRDSRAIPASDVVHDDVVGDGGDHPSGRRGRERPVRRLR